MFLDSLLKIVLFFIATSVVYVFFALMFGSFGGEVLVALGAVSKTIEYAISFEGLTSVYFYSVSLSSFPLFLIGIINAMGGKGRFSAFLRRLAFWLPLGDKPIRTAGVFLSFLFGVFAFTTNAIISIVHV